MGRRGPRASQTRPFRALIAALLLLGGGVAAQQELAVPDEAMAPHVAVGADGLVAVSFAVEDAIWCALSADGGASFSEAVRVGGRGRLEAGLRRTSS